MSDDLSTASSDEPDVEPTEQSAVVADDAGASQEGSPPPWGEDFDPQRAWNTIQHQRAREVELEQQAKQFERLQKDPEAFREFLAERGYELADDDDDDDEDDPDFDPDDPWHKLDALEQRILEREQRELEQQEQAEFAARVKQVEQQLEQELEALGDLDDDQREWILGTALNGPPNESGIPDIKAAHKKYLAFVDAEKKRWAGSKNTSHVASVGTSANEVPDLSDEAQRHAWMQQRLASKRGDQTI